MRACRLVRLDDGVTLFVVTIVVFLAALTLVGHAISASTDVFQPRIDVDINGPYVILRTPEMLDLRNLTIELNGWWSFRLARTMRRAKTCINASAFTVKPEAQVPGNDYSGIHFEPATMKVDTVRISIAGRPIQLHSLTSGMIKPLPPADAATICLSESHK